MTFQLSHGIVPRKAIQAIPKLGAPVVRDVLTLAEYESFRDALPTWRDRLLAKIHLAGEVNRIRQERLGRAYVDGLYSNDDYKREKRSLEDSIAGLVVPRVESAKEAGKLLEDLPSLWAAATLTEQRKLLLTMLDAVYVDTVDEKAVVAIRPKPAFRPLFENATIRAESGVVLINQTPQTLDEPEASEPCCWWRRGRLHLPIPILVDVFPLGVHSRKPVPRQSKRTLSRPKDRW